MFKVVNVSKRAVTVGGIRILPKESYIFGEDTPQPVIDRINALVEIGILKIYKATGSSDENTTSKKGKRK